MASNPIDLLLYLHKVDDRLLFLFNCTINHTTKAALLSSMLLTFNYPVGLHDLCLDSTAAPYFKPSHESPGAADLNLWCSPLWLEKKVYFQDILSSRGVFKMNCFYNKISTITKFKCQTVWIEIRPDVFVSKVQACLTL